MPNEIIDDPVPSSIAAVRRAKILWPIDAKCCRGANGEAITAFAADQFLQLPL